MFSKYEGLNSYQLKDMANVIVFADKEMDKRTSQNIYEKELNHKIKQSHVLITSGGRYYLLSAATANRTLMALIYDIGK